jgi:hypothetical protein
MSDQRSVDEGSKLCSVLYRNSPSLAEEKNAPVHAVHTICFETSSQFVSAILCPSSGSRVSETTRLVFGLGEAVHAAFGAPLKNILKMGLLDQLHGSMPFRLCRQFSAAVL